MRVVQVPLRVAAVERRGEAVDRAHELVSCIIPAALRVFKPRGGRRGEEDAVTWFVQRVRDQFHFGLVLRDLSHRGRRHSPDRGRRAENRGQQKNGAKESRNICIYRVNLVNYIVRAH